MASPLSIFRKYSRAFIVAFGVMLMIAFVIAPVVDDWLRSQSGGPANNPRVVDTKFGRLHERDLDTMRAAHNRAMVFLNELVRETYAREGTPRGAGLFTTGEDRDLVHTYVLARKAESMGLVVSDEAIVEFLEQLSDGVVPPPEIGAIMSRVLADGTPEAYVLDRLRVELLAMRMRSMSQAGLLIPPHGALTPALAWEYFQRLHRRVNAELVPLEVEDFEDRVESSPTEAELEQIYQAGRDRYPDPGQPEPGFKRRSKAVFQYVKFDFDEFVEAEKAKIKDDITSEEIEQYYEQNRQRYEIKEPAAANATSPPGDGSGEPPGEASSADAESETAPDNATPAKPPADPAEPPAKASADAAPSEPDTTESTPDDPTTDAPPPAEPKPEPAPEESNTGQEQPCDTGSSEVNENQAEDPTGEPASAQQESEPTKPDESSTETDKPAAENDKPAASEPAAPPLEGPKTSEKQPAAADSAAEKTAVEPPPVSSNEPDRTEGDETQTDAATEPKFRPLDDELRAEIREELAVTRARALAQTRVVEAKREVRRQVNQVAKAYRKWDFETADDDQREPFVHLNMADLELDELAGASETDLVDALTVQREYRLDNGLPELEIGEAIRTPKEFSWPPQQFPFYQEAFVEGIPMYNPAETGLDSGVSFVYWKIKGEPEYVPEFSEVKEEVIAAWRKAEAFKLARQEAEQLAAKANEANQKLTELFADKPQREVLQPSEFSWMSTGFTAAGFGTPALSSVEGVEGIGNDFMEAVFSLETGEVGVAVNHPQSVAYVVRIDGQTPDAELLQIRFAQTGISNEVAYIAEIENLDLRRQWYLDLEEELNVTWHRDPELQQ